jgi:hypothetical protein
MNLRVVRQFIIRRLKSQYPVLLQSRGIVWRKEPDLAVFGFAVLWCLTALALMMLSWRLNDLANLTAGRWELAVGSGRWWSCVELLAFMAGSSFWVNRATGGSTKEARRRLGW